MTPDLDGLVLRVKVIYQDAHGVLETVFSRRTDRRRWSRRTAGGRAFSRETIVDSPGNGLHLIRATSNSFSTRS